MPPPKKMKPSASRAARSNAASEDPPSQIGIGRVGLGTSAARSIRSKRPEKSTTGSVKSRRSSSICSAWRAPGAEVLAEGLVFDGAPADADPEAQAAAGEQIDIGGLPCHERGLALREDQDPGGELEAFGDGGQ